MISYDAGPVLIQYANSYASDKSGLDQLAPSCTVLISGQVLNSSVPTSHQDKARQMSIHHRRLSNMVCYRRWSGYRSDKFPRGFGPRDLLHALSTAEEHQRRCLAPCCIFSKPEHCLPLISLAISCRIAPWSKSRRGTAFLSTMSSLESHTDFQASHPDRQLISTKCFYQTLKQLK